MRAKNQSGAHGLGVHAVAGGHVVVLCFTLPESATAGLRGFGVHRTDLTEVTAGWLEGMRCFRETDPQFAAPARYSTREHPIQDFFWSDYTAKPGHSYVYRIVALKGTPSDLLEFDAIEVRVQTESTSGAQHSVNFNRGAASSQEYTRRFGASVPDPAGSPDDPKLRWLSRGAWEALAGFVNRAAGPTFALRVAAYEFHYLPFLQELKSALGRGVDVQVVYDAKDNGKPATEYRKAENAFPRDVNRDAIATVGLEAVCTPRTYDASYISHNKFIVLLADGLPVAVLTGSTNFSAGGLFGQANVVHIVDDPAVAKSYLGYWKELEKDPRHSTLQNVLADPLPDSTAALGTVFSPRKDTDALALYGALASGAKGALFMTFAFGMDRVFQDAYRSGTAPLRYALLEKLLGPGVKSADAPAATAAMVTLRKDVANLFAVGATLPLNALDNWVAEKLTGLNSHVRFIHTKLMIVDPLGDHPIVVTGSANFSKASSNENDENMLIIRDDTRVADLYLTEYMRLWEHYAFREYVESRSHHGPAPGHSSGPRPGELDASDAWIARHFADTADKRKREYFSSF